MLNRRRFLGAAAVCGRGATLRAQEDPRADEIRLVSFAPSPYTQRMDSLRAAYALVRRVRVHLAAIERKTVVTLYDGVKRLGAKDVKSIFVPAPRVLLLGSSTWGQGSNKYIRELFEHTDGVSLVGVKASTWVTSGGAHTGGEMVTMDAQRSLQGLGASVFSLGQKQMILTTDEFVDGRKSGEFSLLDVWYLDQFARMIVIQSVESSEAARVAAKLEFDASYYHRFPLPKDAFTAELRQLQEFLGKAASPRSAERAEMLRELR